MHRGLGVHISFVRSISMDAFKQAEIERMRLGGNENWQNFFEDHPNNKMMGITWEDATIQERYNGIVGEEWKERLSAKVEGREYVPEEKKKKSPTSVPLALSPNATSQGGSKTTSPTAQQGGKVKVDEQYFGRLAAENASRPENLPPSQGGRYGGFGNSPSPAPHDINAAPRMSDIQNDPLGALTKGFGWFASTVSKTAQSVNHDYIQPTAKQIADSDLAAQARVAAENMGKAAQQSARSAHDSFNRFVEGPGPGYNPVNQGPVDMDDNKRAFWDEFSSKADGRNAGGSSIGTTAMGKRNAPISKKNDDWDEW